MQKTSQEELLAALRDRLFGELDMLGEFTDEELYEKIDRIILECSRENYISLKDRIFLRSALFNSFRKLDALQELIDDKGISEIMINGADDIFVEKNGKMRRWDRTFESSEKLEDLIQQIVSRINRRVNTASPIVDARLEDGSRVHIVLPPVALNGPTMTIRKFPEPLDMDRMIRNGTVTAEAAEFLSRLVLAGYNIFISGGTSSGKSTFLNALSAYIPSDERVITIEDSAELQIRHVDNLVRLETRDASPGGAEEISMSMLIRASLRMRPDRIIVGEVRGREASDMLAAMNTGHDGSLSTGHANSTKDMLLRLESMVLGGVDLPVAAIRNQICSAVDILVHLMRLPDRSRRVVEITEVLGYEDGEIRLNRIFEYDHKEAALRKTGSLCHTEKLVRKGIDADLVR